MPTWEGKTHTPYVSNVNASPQRRSTSARVASGRSNVWSMTAATFPTSVIQHPDVGEIAVSLSEIKAIAHNEQIWDREANVVELRPFSRLAFLVE